MKKIILLIVLSFSLAAIINSQSIKGNYAIKNVKTGKLLRPQDAGKEDMTPIVLYSPTNWKCLTWEFLPVGNETYHLKNLFSSKTFYGELNKNTGISELKQIPIEKNDIDQLWIFEQAGNGAYRIRVKNSQLYVTPADTAGRINTPVVLKPIIYSDLQLWTIYEQDPKF